MPGIILVAALNSDIPRDMPCRALAERAAAPLRPSNPVWALHVDQPHVCLATITPRADGGPQRIQKWSQRRVTVVMQGYLARPSVRESDPTDAQIVAEHYAGGGPLAVEQFDGSFVIVAIDEQARSITIWTDRVATRPCYLAAVGGHVVVAPELKCFHSLPNADRSIVPGSLAAMAMNGALLDEHTYYRGVQLLGPARRISIGPHGLRIERYWQRAFECDPDEPPPSPDDVAERICDATARHIRRFDRPILALSGGLDSRILLAACRRAGLVLPTVTWGFDHVDTPGSDFELGRALARRFNLTARLRPMDVAQLPHCAAHVVGLTDGLTGHLGNYTEADTVARELATEHDALIRGDEMFGWAAAVDSPAQALRRVGVNVGKRLKLLRFLLRRDRADAVLADYRAQQKQLLDSFDPHTPPDDIKDILYWQTRFPRLIASQAAVFRAHLDVVAPLLDATVIDLVRECTPAQREHKRFMASCVQTAFAEEFELPLNTVHSRASWRTRFKQLGPVQQFFVQTLLEPLNTFDEWFDRTAIRAWLAAALPDGRNGVWPEDSTWLGRRRAQLRALLLKPTFKERVIVNLTTLKLWFRQFG